MSTILTAIIIIALTILFPWLFISRHKKALKRQDQANLRRFSDAGTERHLSFSRQDIIKNKIIGFDGLKQQIMIIELELDYEIIFFAIKDLKNCKMEKEYRMAGDITEDKEKILQEIRLVFNFLDNRSPITLLFYSYSNDSIYTISEMQAKAMDWQISVSKLILKLSQQHTNSSLL